MGAYEYKAVDTGGKQRKGLLEGDTARQVRQMLRETGLLPIEVTEVAQKEKTERRSAGISTNRGVSPLDLALITRQLATMVRAGLPLDEALLAVSQQNDKTRLKTILLGVRARVLEGHPLATGLADFPNAFPEIYRATVAAGEQSGRLDNVLERLAEYTESRHELRQRTSNAMVYPIILVVMSVGIVGFLMTYIVPKVVGMFDKLGGELPGLTRLMIDTSDFLRANGIVILVLLTAAFIGFKFLMRRPGPREQYHRFLLRVPIIGRLNRGINTARFTRTLSILTASSVPVLEALRIASTVVANDPMRAAIDAAAARVREGAPIGLSLAASKLFPPMTIHLISGGETSGELEDMLERAAVNQEREVDTLIANLLTALQPIMIIAMGGIVLTIVLAILLPILDINSLVNR